MLHGQSTYRVLGMSLREITYAFVLNGYSRLSYMSLEQAYNRKPWGSLNVLGLGENKNYVRIVHNTE